MICAYDIETSGFGPRVSHIIQMTFFVFPASHSSEVDAALMKGGGLMMRARPTAPRAKCRVFSTYIMPFEAFDPTFNSAAFNAHGATLDKLQGAPGPRAACGPAAGFLRDSTAGRPTVMVGHNAQSFDWPFVSYRFRRHDAVAPANLKHHIDTLHLWVAGNNRAPDCDGWVRAGGGGAVASCVGEPGRRSPRALYKGLAHASGFPSHLGVRAHDSDGDVAATAVIFTCPSVCSLYMGMAVPINTANQAAVRSRIEAAGDDTGAQSDVDALDGNGDDGDDDGSGESMGTVELATGPSPSGDDNDPAVVVDEKAAYLDTLRFTKIPRNQDRPDFKGAPPQPVDAGTGGPRPDREHGHTRVSARTAHGKHKSPWGAVKALLDDPAGSALDHIVTQSNVYIEQRCAARLIKRQLAPLARQRRFRDTVFECEPLHDGGGAGYAGRLAKYEAVLGAVDKAHPVPPALQPKQMTKALVWKFHAVLLSVRPARHAAGLHACTRARARRGALPRPSTHLSHPTSHRYSRTGRRP